MAQLHQRTEGWAAGLRLAAISLTGNPDPERFVTEFTGSSRTIAEYLIAEMLERQPAEVQNLLLRTSVLDRVNGELADLLTGRSGAERMLHTPGRKSGKELVNPLVAAPYGGSYIVCGTAGGAPQDPQWVANLEAVDGPVTIELGTDTAQADHRVVRPGRDEDWDQLYAVWRAYWPDAAAYEKNTDRKFRVAVITVR